MAPPSRANGAILPAALAALLLAMALVQLTLTHDVDLPEAGVAGGGAPVASVPASGLASIAPVIAARPIFAPRGGTAATVDGATAAPVDRLGGAVIAGSVRVGRILYAVVQRKGAIVRVPIGGGIAGWRLMALSDGGAKLARGGEHLSVAFGAAPANQGDAPASGEDSSQ